MTLNLNFPDNGWESIAHNWSAWWAGELDRALVVLECVEPQDESSPHYASTFLGNFSLNIPIDDLLNLFIPRLQAIHYLGDAFPRFWPNFGPGIVAAKAGARLHAVPDTTWFSPSFEGEINHLTVGKAEQNAWWQRVISTTRAAVERWGTQLSIGFTDLGGNLDILAHLRGTQQLLLDLIDAPGEIDRLVSETNQLWLKCYDELYRFTQHSCGITCWGPCWSPGPGYLLQSDFSYMISPQMFERFVLPDLTACCQGLDYAFYHLDGKGQLPHLETLLSMKRLRGIQWVPGDGQPQAEHWLSLMDHIRQNGKLCQVSVSAQGALTILRELGGCGLLLVVNEPLTPQQGKALLDEVYRVEKTNKWKIVS
jgi:5-methyltetrahydrofolate--homocysteine methyltransferase